jgi:hypothetical protein
MRVVTRAAAVAGGALAILACAGFSGGGGHAAASRGSVQACTAFGVRAIEHHLTVRAVPSACQGLSRAQVNLAIGRAIYEVAGAGQHKSAWRRRAVAAGDRLDKLITSLPPAASPPPGTRTGAAAGSAPPDRLPLGLATLAAWLAAAATGGYITARRVSRGGRLRRGPGRGGAVATVLSGHAGLAATGLLVWVSFLVSGLTGLAWVAACLLLPVAGLGMATLTLWSPGPRPGPAGPPGQVPGQVPTLTAATFPAGGAGAAPPGPAPQGPAAPGPGPEGPGPRGTQDGTAPHDSASSGSASSGSASSGSASSRVEARPRRSSPVRVILPIVHGLAAMATILLALLTAVGAG